METAEAYRDCERITWSQARNFAYGIRLLPADKRRALATVYAFARRIDDIGDGAMPAADKLAALEAARKALAAVTDAALAAGPAGTVADTADAILPGQHDDPVLTALTDVARRFPVPMAAFNELIDGCVADVRGTSYPTFDGVLGYCRQVAGSIGRLSLGVFGAADMVAAAPLADALGVALQLTNILRDVREDYRSGRVYLPAEDLDRFGCTLAALADDGGRGAVGHGEGVRAARPHGLDAETENAVVCLIEFEVDRARTWYATGMRLLPMLDRRSAACTGAMAGIYARLLDRIAAQPSAVLAGRLSLPSWEKAAVAARSLAGLTARPRPAPAGTPMSEVVS